MAECPNPECRNTELTFLVDDCSHIECQKCHTKWSTYKHRTNDAYNITYINIPNGKYSGVRTRFKSIKKLLENKE